MRKQWILRATRACCVLQISPEMHRGLMFSREKTSIRDSVHDYSEVKCNICTTTLCFPWSKQWTQVTQDDIRWLGSTLYVRLSGYLDSLLNCIGLYPNEVNHITLYLMLLGWIVSNRMRLGLIVIDYMYLGWLGLDWLGLDWIEFDCIYLNCIVLYTGLYVDEF